MMNTTLRESPGAQCLRLQDEAKVARKRFQRYKARAYGPGVTNVALLFELQRAFVVAESRLRQANPAAQVSRGSHAVART
jgi:hypothetical protein